MIHKILRQLKREMFAHKGRAAFLLSATMVAIYYWVTAIGGMLPEETAETASKATTLTVREVVAVATPTETAVPPASDWQDLANALERDPLMKTAKFPTTAGNPFRRFVEDPSDGDDQDGEGRSEGRESTADIVTPETLGMVLNSSLVGTKITVVKISGRTFSFASDHRQASGTRDLVFENDQGSFQFVVVSAQSGRLVLARDDQQYELTIGSPVLAGNEQVQFLRGSD